MWNFRDTESKKVNYTNHISFKRKKDKHSTENWWYHMAQC